MIIIYPPKIYPVPIRKIGQEITPYSSIWLELFTTNSNSTHNTTYSEDPVSDRNIISDHATNEPLEITEEITLYDDPSTYSFIGQQALAEDEEFSKVVWEYLEMLRTNFAVMKVRTHEGIYESMTIRSLRPIKDNTSGNTIGLTATFREYQTSETIESFNAQLDPEDSDTAKQTTTKTDKGKVPKNEVDATSKKGVDRTTLDTIYNKVL